MAANQNPKNEELNEMRGIGESVLGELRNARLHVNANVIQKSMSRMLIQRSRDNAMYEPSAAARTRRGDSDDMVIEEIAF